MFFKMLSADRMHLFRRPLWRNVVIILCFVPLITGLFSFLIAEGYIGYLDDSMKESLMRSITWPNGMDNAQSPILSSGTTVGRWLMFVISPLFIARSYRDRTIQNWITRGVHRPQIVLSKFVNLMTALLLIILVPLLITGIVMTVITLIKGETINVADVDWVYVGSNAFTLFYTGLPYVAFACFLAVLTRSAVASMAGTLLLAFALDLVFITIAQFFEGIFKIIRFLPSSLEDSLSSWVNGDSEQLVAELLGVELLAPGWAAVAILLYTLLFLALTILVFRRQDLGG